LPPPPPADSLPVFSPLKTMSAAPAVPQKFITRIAAAQKEADALKKAAQTAKAELKRAKKKYKQEKKLAKAAKKAVKMLRDEMKAATIAKKRPARKPRPRPVAVNPTKAAPAQPDSVVVAAPVELTVVPQPTEPAPPAS